MFKNIIYLVAVLFLLNGCGLNHSKFSTDIVIKTHDGYIYHTDEDKGFYGINERLLGWTEWYNSKPTEITIDYIDAKNQNLVREMLVHELIHAITHYSGHFTDITCYLCSGSEPSFGSILCSDEFELIENQPDRVFTISVEDDILIEDVEEVIHFINSMLGREILILNDS